MNGHMSRANIRPFKGILPKIAESAYIDESAVIIGDVSIGQQSSIWCTCVLRGDVNSISVGDRSNIQDGSILHVTHKNPIKHPDGYPLIIGDDVTVAHNVTLHGCTLEDESFVGMSSTVMDGAVVQSRSMVGAGTLVPPGKIIETGWLYIGSPAKKFRQLTESEMNSFAKLADNYVNYSREYM